VRARERQENEKEGAFEGWWEDAASFQQYDGVCSESSASTEFD